MHYTFALFLLFAATSPPPSLSFSSASASAPDRFSKPFPSRSVPQEFIEITHPLPSDYAAPFPTCTLALLSHSFADTINKPPFTTRYSPPPDCPGPWTRVILEFHATCKGEQYARIVGLWLGGCELLRTSTAEPSQSGIFWTVRKDVTRYSSLLARSKLKVTMMLENVVNDVYTGIYHVNCTLFFYNAGAVMVPSIPSPHDFDSNLGPQPQSFKYFGTPADLIIPIADDGEKGHWFRIEAASDLKFKKVRFPINAYRVVLELYVSFHGKDEFWYSNPPDSYIESNNLPTDRGNGNFREVFVTIDRNFAASEFPLPVIYTGGINPLFWEPVVAIGAFNLPTYDLELTPFLGRVLDGRKHEIGIGVNDAISYWLVNANLHIWLDHKAPRVWALSSVYHYPRLSINRGESFKLLDGRFEIKAKRKTKFAGWVKSSLGNLTTAVSRHYGLKSIVKFKNNGTYKLVHQKAKVTGRVQVRNELLNLTTHLSVRRRSPLDVFTSTLPGSRKDRYLQHTNLSHLIRETISGEFRSSLANHQVSTGWMKVKDHSMRSGKANTTQSFSYTDAFACYDRDVFASNGKLVSDKPKPCAASF